MRDGFSRLDTRLDGSDGVLLSLLKQALQPTRAALSPAEGQAAAAALLPPEPASQKPAVSVVLSRAGCPSHARRLFALSEPALRLRRWAEAATPGCLTQTPALRFSAEASGEGGELLDDTPGLSVGQALERGGHGGQLLMFLVVL